MRGVRHRGFALHIVRQEGMHGGDCRPGVLVCTEEPDGIGGEAGGFCGAGDLDGSIDGLRREEDVFGGVFEFGEEFVPGDSTSIEAEGTGGVECLLPAAQRLKFDACLRWSGRASRSSRVDAGPCRPIRWGSANAADSLRLRWAEIMRRFHCCGNCGGDSAPD